MQNNTVGYLIRKAGKKDTRAVWAIRNNPLNRNNFNSLDEIPFDRHEKWFEKKYFGGQDNKCFILEIQGKVIGYCRFDSDDGGYTTSIAVDPEYIGKGFGGILLGEALRELKADKDVLPDCSCSDFPFCGDCVFPS